MTADDLTTVRADQFYPHSPAKVRWLMPNDFRPVVGHRFTFTAAPVVATNFSGVIACEVLEIRPLERLRITWRDADGTNPLDSTVTFHVRPEGRGTRLIVEHHGFDPDDPGQQIARRIMDGGWRSQVLRRLAAVLDRPDGSTPGRSDPEGRGHAVSERS
jgi:uncharacterized protein YndB with AHSA1/START domain